MTYKAFIFDFDGVLFDSESIHLYACNQVFKTLGFTISKEEYFQRYIGLPDNKMFPFILSDKAITCPPENINSLQNDKIAAFKSYLANTKSFDGVKGVRIFIQHYIKLINRFAICSAGTRDEIETALEKLEHGQLKPYFSHIVSIEDINHGKPSPDGYLLAAKKLNVPPKDCLVIEDTPVGIKAAKNAGMTVAGITTTHKKEKLTNANFVADSYEEIHEWLNTARS